MSMISSSSRGGGGGGGGGGGRVVGDYIFGRQIGSGSFSVVWLATHRIRGTEVAVKEIAMDRLSKKLRESLMSEIVILRKINHPNIITLHEIIKASGRIFLILEYCKGGDLSIYLRHRGRVPEATAKHFMQQLASGLQVLRDNNLIHRDLKPQNLLLSKNDETAILKIADFGFARLFDKFICEDSVFKFEVVYTCAFVAISVGVGKTRNFRSLQPMGLAETLCGSPLYMAPEIMQLQKYDAKADLWSVGAILFQLVTGKTPFTGNSQMQLLQNIIKSTELSFPRGNNDLSVDCIDLCQKLLRRNPVERLTFEEFFNHSFLLPSHPHGSCSPCSRTLDRRTLTTSSLAALSLEDDLQEELPFTLDDSGPDAMVSTAVEKPLIKPTYGFSVDTGIDKKSDGDIPSDKLDNFSKYSSKNDMESTDYKICWENPLLENIKESKSSIEQKISVSEDPAVVDSLEFIDQEYVLVPGPPLEISSSSQSLSRQHNSSCESEGSSPPKSCAYTAPLPIIVGRVGNRCAMGSPEKYHHFGTSQKSMDMGDEMDKPSSHSTTRLRSLQQYASAVSELVKEKVDLDKPLEAFSVQLVILAIWKQALHICHAQAASALEGSPSQETKVQGNVDRKVTFDSREFISSTEFQQPESSQIERAFLLEVETAESLAKHLDVPDNTEMPDAMEIIFQYALSLGRKGGVDELMDNADRANSLYSKAVRLLNFLLVEAPSLILNPPFSLTYSDKMRLRSYIDHLKNRYFSQRELLKGDEQ